MASSDGSSITPITSKCFAPFLIIGLYEAIRHVFTALIYGCARPRMAVLFLSSIFPHVYGWWANFNYFNDEYYSQWWHQCFFSLTELSSTLMVLHLVNKNNFRNVPKKLLFIIRYVCRQLVFTYTVGQKRLKNSSPKKNS